MSVEMVMPKMGESITEGTILKWLKGEGDAVEKDEIILEISTDKVDSEIPSPNSGVLAKILAAEGDVVEVGSIIAEIDEGGSAAPKAEAPKEEAAPEPETAPEPEPVAEPEPEPEEAAAEAEPEVEQSAAAVPNVPNNRSMPREKGRGEQYFSPLVRSIAEKEGIALSELNSVAGTGRNGRITKNDILAYVANRKRGTRVPEAPPVQGSMPKLPDPPPSAGSGLKSGETREVEMDNMRKAIADHMIKSVQTSAHVYSISEANVSQLVEYRESVKDEFLRREGFKLTYQPFFMYAAAKALRDFPDINASLEGSKIILKGSINIGMAVALDSGLIVPVVKDADTLNLLGMARACFDLAQRARTRKLMPTDVEGGTFSITNLGSFGNLYGTPIISQPQVAILGVGAIKKRVVVENNAIAIRDMLYVSLGYDHRLIDGALGGKFLQRVVHYLETMNPEQI